MRDEAQKNIDKRMEVESELNKIKLYSDRRAMMTG